MVENPELDVSKSRQVLWIHHYATAPEMPSSPRHWEMPHLLKDLGWQANVVASGFSHVQNRFLRDVSPTKLHLQKIEEGVQFTWVYTTPYHSNGILRYVNNFVFFILALLIRPAKRPDIVVGTTPHLLAPLAAWLLAKRFRVPFVLEVQDLWPESLIQLGLSNPIVIHVLRKIERFLYLRADAIITLSDGISMGVKRVVPRHRSITLIPNATMRPSPLDLSQRISLREALGWSDALICIWIGAHGPANGLELIVETARKLVNDKRIRFVLVGDGIAKRGLVQQSEGLRNIEFLNSIPKSRVDSYLRAADIGLLIHRDTEAVKGARPNKLFDYMSAALPIITTMDGEVRGIIETVGSGVFSPPERVEPFVQSVVALANEQGLRQDMGARGFEYILSTHNREVTAVSLARVLNGLVENRDR